MFRIHTTTKRTKNLCLIQTVLKFSDGGHISHPELRLHAETRRSNSIRCLCMRAFFLLRKSEQCVTVRQMCLWDFLCVCLFPF